jgi:hypothetical protein
LIFFVEVNEEKKGEEEERENRLRDDERTGLRI